MEATNADNDEMISSEDKTSHTLEVDMELRFEVELNGDDEKPKSPAFLELESGTAELFGTQLVPKKKYRIYPGNKAAVFTWHGCVLNTYGHFDVVYIAQGAAMVTYLNLHNGLNQKREKADKEMGRGPRIMVVGPTDAGKSALCKILVNYAARSGWSPMFVDLDVEQNDIAIPGMIAAFPICLPADIEEGYISLNALLVYHYGRISPADNVDHYNTIIHKLAESINMKCEISNRHNVSGAIINTCGWVRDKGYQCLLKTIHTFEVDVVVALEQDLLYNNLVRDVPDFVRVVPLPKSGGVVERGVKARTERRKLIIHNYLYGVKHNLFPRGVQVKFADVQIFRIGVATLNDCLMPLTASNQDDHDSHIKLVPVPITPALQYHILSTSFASSRDEDIVTTNVSGFVNVKEVNMEEQTLTLLSPAPPPFPWNILLLIEGLTYVETC